MQYSHFGTARGTGWRRGPCADKGLEIHSCSHGGHGSAAGACLCARHAGPDEARKRLEADKGRLDTTQKRSKDLKSIWIGLLPNAQRINARLIETGKLIHQSEGATHPDRVEVDQLQAQEKQLRTTLEERHGAISGLLAAMQRMGRNPPPVMITRREDALSMVRSAMLLAAVFPELRGQAMALAEQLKDLSRVMTSIRTEGEKLRTETVRLGEARTRLGGASGGEAAIAVRAAGGAG